MKWLVTDVLGVANMEAVNESSFSKANGRWTVGMEATDLGYGVVRKDAGLALVSLVKKEKKKKTTQTQKLYCEMTPKSAPLFLSET